MSVSRYKTGKGTRDSNLRKFTRFLLQWQPGPQIDRSTLKITPRVSELKASGNSATQQAALMAAGFMPVPVENNGADVWQFSLASDDSTVTRHALMLSSDELERASKHKSTNGFRQFVVARSMLRQLLAIYTGVNPAKLAFSYGPYGKPKLTGDPSVEFNVAHSGERVIYAISDKQPVGVDIERIGRTINSERLAKRFFSNAEYEALQAISPASRQQAFLRLWTGKEAIVKVTGKGLAQLIGKFEITNPFGYPALIISRESPQLEKIRLYYPDPGEGYIAAVALLPAQNSR